MSLKKTLRSLSSLEAWILLENLGYLPDACNAPKFVIDGELLSLIDNISDCSEIGIMNKSPLIMKKFLKKLQEYREDGVPLPMLEKKQDQKRNNMSDSNTNSLTENEKRIILFNELKQLQEKQHELIDMKRKICRLYERYEQYKPFFQSSDRETFIEKLKEKIESLPSIAPKLCYLLLPFQVNDDEEIQDHEVKHCIEEHQQLVQYLDKMLTFTNKRGKLRDNVRYWTEALGRVMDNSSAIVHRVNIRDFDNEFLSVKSTMDDWIAFFRTVNTPTQPLKEDEESNSIDNHQYLKKCCVSLYKGNIYLSLREYTDKIILTIDSNNRKKVLSNASHLCWIMDERESIYELNRYYKEYSGFLQWRFRTRPESLFEALEYVAQMFEMNKEYFLAELFYTLSGNASSAVNMYRSLQYYDQMLRLFQQHSFSWKRLLLIIFHSEGYDNSLFFLKRFGYIHVYYEVLDALDFGLEASLMFEEDFAQRYPTCLDEYWTLTALRRASSGYYDEGEDMFLKAHNPFLAVEMYVKHHRWSDAQRVAKLHAPELLEYVLLMEGKREGEEGRLERAEELMVKAGYGEVAVGMYMREGMWREAERVARAHAPECLDSCLLARSGLPPFVENSFNNAVDAVIMLIASSNESSDPILPMEVQSFCFLQPCKDNYALVIERFGCSDKWFNCLKEGEQHDALVQATIRDDINFSSEQLQELGDYCKSKKQFHEAKILYLRSHNRLQAIQMYCSERMWDEMLSVIDMKDSNKNMDSNNGGKECIQFIKAVGVKEALRYFNLMSSGTSWINKIIDYALMEKEFDTALTLITEQKGIEQKIALCKLGKTFGENSLHSDAEDMFLKAHNPFLAVEMYVKQLRWSDAQRVARLHAPELLEYVLLMEGKREAEEGRLERAEELMVKAGYGEVAVGMYMREGSWREAERIARAHAPECLDLVTNRLIKDFDGRCFSTLNDHLSYYCSRSGWDGKAEELIIANDQIDEAIRLLKQRRKWYDYLRLIELYRPAQLMEASHHLAMSFEMEGSYSEAEEYYRLAGKEDYAIIMYCSVEMWDDALRLARSHKNRRRKELSVLCSLLESGSKELCALLSKHRELIECFLTLSSLFHGDLQELEVDLKHHGLLSMNSKRFYKHFGVCAETHRERFEEAEDWYIKAHNPFLAVEMYIKHHRWSDAQRIARLHAPELLEYVLLMEGKREGEEGRLERAEELMVKAGYGEVAVGMYMREGSWREAERVARAHAPECLEVLRKMIPPDCSLLDLFLLHANRYEQSDQLFKAEMMFLLANKPYSAIQMYKSHYQWLDMLRVTVNHCDDAMTRLMYRFMAQLAQSHRSWYLAEHYYVLSNDHDSWITMYQKEGLWKELLRAMMTHFPHSDQTKTQFHEKYDEMIPWKEHILLLVITEMPSYSDACRLLQRYHLIEDTIQALKAVKLYEKALDLAKDFAPVYIRELNQRLGEKLDKKQLTREAEERYLLAQCPMLAINMYVKHHRWSDAQRVAKLHAPELLEYVLLMEGKREAEEGRLERAEELMVKAGYGEVAVGMYMREGMWREAERVARAHSIIDPSNINKAKEILEDLLNDRM